MRRWLRAVMAAALMSTTVVIASPGPAQAAVPPFGLCRWTEANPVIDVVASLTTVYQSALSTAMNRWNRTGNVGYFQYADSGANIRATQVNSAEDFWARTGGVSCTNRRWAATVPVTFNVRTMNGLTERQKWVVAVHELGHSYGLGDLLNGMNCDLDPSVMEQGEHKFSCRGTPPWPDDVTGVDNIY